MKRVNRLLNNIYFALHNLEDDEDGKVLARNLKSLFKMYDIKYIKEVKANESKRINKTTSKDESR